jgi:hypothetical protein
MGKRRKEKKGENEKNMKRIVLVLVMVLVLLTAAPLYGQEELSRGEFAAMLVEAGKMESNLSPADLLVQKGIMKGYPDGELYLDRGITRMEAIALTAKTLGMAESVVPPAEGDISLNKDHWGYTFYSWLNIFGLMDGNPEDALTEEEGSAFLEKVFTSDPEAILLQEKIKTDATDIESLRSVVNGNMKMILRPGAEGTEEIPQMGFQMNIVQEMVFPDTMHQVSTMSIDIPGLGKQDMSSEMYLVDGKIYQQLPLDETGEMQWVLYPEGLFPDLGQLMNAEEAGTTIPAGMEDYLHCQLLGTSEFNGEEVYQLATYGRVDDLDLFLEAISKQLGTNGQMAELLGQGLAMIDSMSLWCIEYIGANDYLTKSVDMFMIITLAEEFAGEPNPLEAIQMNMKVEEISYNEDIVIELPEEAKNASLMDLSELFPNQEQLQELPEQEFMPPIQELMPEQEQKQLQE